MSKRTERREAERQTRKLAYQNLRQQKTQYEPAAVEPPTSQQLAGGGPEESLKAHTVSEAQLAANRANAERSTGPITPEGRARSSQNALKTGLTGKTVLLPNEDAAQYQRELDQYVSTYQPANDEEMRLVQSLNDCVWRIDRIQRLETGILLKGDIEFAGKYENHNSRERFLLIQADAYIKYEKQLRNLHIQESRLRRVMEKDRAELLRLQALRKREEAKNPLKPENGFDFSSRATAQDNSGSSNPEDTLFRPSEVPPDVFAQQHS
jgi:hypothetical protein